MKTVLETPSVSIIKTDAAICQEKFKAYLSWILLCNTSDGITEQHTANCIYVTHVAIILKLQNTYVMYSTTTLLKDINRLQNMVHIERYIDMYGVIHSEAAMN
jgi:hypothetical protein